MHWYSNRLSVLAIISSLIILEILPAWFSFNNNFNFFYKTRWGLMKKIMFSFVLGFGSLILRKICFERTCHDSW